MELLIISYLFQHEVQGFIPHLIAVEMGMGRRLDCYRKSIMSSSVHINWRVALSCRTLAWQSIFTSSSVIVMQSISSVSVDFFKFRYKSVPSDTSLDMPSLK